MHSSRNPLLQGILARMTVALIAVGLLWMGVLWAI